MTNETVLTISGPARMRGVFSSAPSQTLNRSIALFFNAGGLHRVGPYRLWVDVARSLANNGVSSFRFDICGLGDSDDLPTQEGNSGAFAVGSVVAAMDGIQAHLGRECEFVLFGLCSGADQAHAVAKTDPRVRGIAFLDAYGYRTRQYYLHQFRLRALSGRRWRNWIAKCLTSPSEIAKSTKSVTTADFREFPPALEIKEDIQRFLDQGLRLLYIYSDGVPEYYNYKNQFWDMFPGLKPHRNLSVQYFPTADHSFSLISDREPLMRQLVRFAIKEGQSELLHY